MDFTSDFFKDDIALSDRVLDFFRNLYFSCFDRSRIDHIAEKNLLKDLGSIRKDVNKEHQWFDKGCQLRYINESESHAAKRKRLLYLFIRDLMSGVGGNVLDNKDARDNGRLAKVSPYSKFFAWLLVAILNGGMLFYVYLFARSQTQSRQSAWFISFVMWFFFEIFVSSTAVVFVTHLLIPLYVLSDVRNIKKKVLADIMAFHKAALNKKLRGYVPSSTEESSSAEFNAAKYLYRSWRVASLFPNLKESEVILSFQTPWPQRCYKKDAVSVHSVYERRYSFLYQAVSRVAIFFLASLLNLPQLAQDWRCG